MKEILESILWYGAVLLVIVGPIALLVWCVYAALFVDKRGMSSRQAAEYWREKFRDETVVQVQRETLLRASKETETPDVLLRAVQEIGLPQTPLQQLVRPAGGQEPR